MSSSVKIGEVVGSTQPNVKAGARQKTLTYSIHDVSSVSSSYVARNIMDNKPSDQASRWSSDTNTPTQFVVLKLEDRPAVVSHITFGKFEKTHVCNLKRFKVFVGTDTNNMIEVIDSGLRNDSVPETFRLRHVVNGHLFPCRYIKIVPIQSWGPSFNFSIWYVALQGDDDPAVVREALDWHRKVIEREAVRICLKYFRQKNYMSVFEDLQKKSKVKLEHPQLTEIYDSIFSKGDFLETEALVKSSVEGGLFDEWIEMQKTTAEWSPIILPDETIPDDYSSSPSMITISQTTMTVQDSPVAPEDRSSRNNSQVEHQSSAGSKPGVGGGAATTSSCRDLGYNSPINRLQPGPRGGHQMVIDSMNQQIYLFGGWDGYKDLSDFWSYHIPTSKWTLVSGNTQLEGGPSRRSCHKMVIDTENKLIFVLGRYLERTVREALPSVKSDFYMYDISANKWTLISDDTLAMGGPTLIFDHQMCIDVEARNIYVFGGQSISSCVMMSTSTSSSDTEDSSRCNRLEKLYSGLYKYHIPTNTWTLLREDGCMKDDLGKTICGRTGHTMLFNSTNRCLYVFGGQRGREDYMNDFFIYNVDTDIKADVGQVRGVEMANAPGSVIPAVGHTHRSTIDSKRGEIHVMTGLSKDDLRVMKATAQVDHKTTNSFWVFKIPENRWRCHYENNNTDACYWNEMQRKQPRPRYAHQLVYDDVNRVHFMFGGNPGGRQGREEKIRLGDFWNLKLIRSTRQELLRTCLLQIRLCKFMEMAQNEETLAEALQFLQGSVYDVVDHSNPEEQRAYQAMAGRLFRTPAEGQKTPKKRAKSEGVEFDLDPQTVVEDAVDIGDQEERHRNRTKLFGFLSSFFPAQMTQPRSNLMDVVPLPLDDYAW